MNRAKLKLHRIGVHGQSSDVPYMCIQYITIVGLYENPKKQNEIQRAKQNPTKHSDESRESEKSYLLSDNAANREKE